MGNVVKQRLHRAGAVCASLGAVITAVFYGVHPDLADPVGILAVVANSSHFVDIHWGLIIGMVLMQFGFVAVTLILREQPARNDAAGWAESGLYALFVGLALWICVFVAEVALKPLADGLRADPTLLGGARALAGLIEASGTAATIVYWVGVTLFGAALLGSERFPRWMGAIGLALGAIISLGIGFPRAFLGQSVWTEKIGFPIFATLTLLWIFMLGVMLWRMSRPKLRQAGQPS